MIADDEERILVLAPLGRDAPLLGQVLTEGGFRVTPSGDLAALAEELQAGAGAVVLTEEALSGDLSPLLDALRDQPPWSDLPLVLLAEGEPLSPGAVDALRAAGNLTVLERPLRVLTLVTAVNAALRARRRQYQLRDLVDRERAAREAAETASRVKDAFLATVSHELRTPLGAILLLSLIHI